MAANNAAPRCYVDIYPYEGGKYSLTGDAAGVLSCITHKDIRSTGPGTFDIKLAPGGPLGPNSGPSWTEIITPMSLVVIGMKRYHHRQIVMIGVVTEPIETQTWETGRGVQRVINIRGGDFQYLFSTFSYYTLSLLGATRGVSLSQGGVNLGLPELLGKALLSGTPAQVGAAWFNVVMGGTEGILAQTNYMYNGAKVSFPNIMASLFEEYPTTNGGVRIPYSNFYMITSGNWTEKFLQTFPFPWYEFFVTTAPVGYRPYDTQNNTIAYNSATNQSYVSTGMSGAATPISMNAQDGTGFLPASPTLVARVNPLPYTSSYNNGKFVMDSSRWQNNLQRFSLENTGFIKSTVAFNTSEVRNFYVINPTFFTQQFGISNSNMNAFIYTFASWIDNASIHRYGYRPEIFQIQWFSDPSGQQAQLNVAQQENFQQLVQNLALRQTSYFEPTPNMAKGSVSMELRPDILPGNVFTYSPFKNGSDWDFYITGVTQTYIFGEQSNTTLSIDRGLPKSVYDDVQMLTALHTGTAIRQNGKYNVPNPIVNGLQPISIGTTSIQQILGQSAQIFTTPQGATGQ
jgi:hypothetical protein